MKNRFLLLALSTFIYSFINASVVYVDINPDTTLLSTGQTARMDIDLNNDGTADYRISTVDTMGFSFVYVQAGQIATSNFVQCHTAGTAINAIAWPYSPLVGDSSGNWHSMGAGNATMVSYTSIFGKTGEWVNAQDYYLAVKFLIGSSYHYGWIRMQVNQTTWDITFKDYAYESTAGASVPVSVNNINAGKPDVKVFQAADNSVLNFSVKTAQLPVSVELVDMQGRIVGTKVLEDNNAAKNISLDVSGITAGVYVYRLRFEGDVLLTGKTYISTK